MARWALFAAALAALAPSACGLALGLSDFSNGSPDSGSGGATLDGGSGGSAGIGRDGGNDAPNDGPATCTCLPPAPTGWTGPLALFNASAAAPSCAGGWTTFLDSGGTHFTGLPAKCTACSCGVSAPPTCNVQIETATASTCNSGTDTNTVAGNGQCVALHFSGTDQGTAFVQAHVTDVTANSGTCTTSGGAPTPATAAFTDHMRACKLASKPPSCRSGNACAPPVPTGFPGGRYCIAKQLATATCPTSGAYTQQYTVATALADTRSCSSCQCSIASGSGVACDQNTSVALTFDHQAPTTIRACAEALTGPGVFQGSLSQCQVFHQELSGGVGGATSANAVSATAVDQNAACKVSSTTPSGTVKLDPAHTWVFCCTQ